MPGRHARPGNCHSPNPNTTTMHKLKPHLLLEIQGSMRTSPKHTNCVTWPHHQLQSIKKDPYSYTWHQLSCHNHCRKTWKSWLCWPRTPPTIGAVLAAAAALIKATAHNSSRAGLSNPPFQGMGSCQSGCSPCQTACLPAAPLPHTGLFLCTQRPVKLLQPLSAGCSPCPLRPARVCVPAVLPWLVP